MSVIHRFAKDWDPEDPTVAWESLATAIRDQEIVYFKSHVMASHETNMGLSCSPTCICQPGTFWIRVKDLQPYPIIHIHKDHVTIGEDAYRIGMCFHLENPHQLNPFFHVVSNQIQLCETHGLQERDFSFRPLPHKILFRPNAFPREGWIPCGSGILDAFVKIPTSILTLTKKGQVWTQFMKNELLVRVIVCILAKFAEIDHDEVILKTMDDTLGHMFWALQHGLDPMEEVTSFEAEFLSEWTCDDETIDHDQLDPILGRKFTMSYIFRSKE